MSRCLCYGEIACLHPLKGANYIIGGEVDIYSPDLACESGSLINSSVTCTSDGCEQQMFNAVITTPTCAGYYVPVFQKSPSFTDVFISGIHAVGCMNSTTLDRVIIVAARWTNDTAALFQSLVCVSSYNISNGQVSLKGNGTVISISPNTTAQSTGSSL